MDIYLPIAGMSVNALLIIALGLLVGLLSGMFGVGGGFVIVPALTLVLGMSMPEAIGTSLVLPDKHLPAHLTVLPVPNRPVFPGQALPLILRREPWEATLARAMNSSTPQRLDF